MLAAIAGIALALLGLIEPAGADTGSIYRCQADDGSLVFSDLPCDERAEPIRIEGHLSVIASADGLASIARSNAAFLEMQRAEREARRDAEQRQRQAERARSRRVPPMMVPVPVYIDPTRPTGPLRPQVPERTERLQQRGERSRLPTDERRLPISPLSGRQLGARRGSDEDG
ncbi:hypothetical protein HFP89_04295 [Wenzhouxiangella sp. XN79A]|uniref:hypothetical protein n=1 Tax=Wenzhouxiangella sp. XN79A TaxID=2724193 RepID=UPI00144AB762|nr:hypothetical protein [Wenzhouxiangella sp. XN79A]NKI34380.1 hypothetical protein [Wenzhouxiangella sp. XN79A]